MHEALYHPDFGYYTAHINALGPRGDFATTVTLTPLLAQSLAAFLTFEEARYRRKRPTKLPKRLVGHPPAAPPNARERQTKKGPAKSTFEGSFTLLEIGPGNGSLAHDLLAALPWRLRRKTKLHLVEISPRLQTLQKQRLKKYQKQISWHTDITDALSHIDQDAHLFVLSNELVDAFSASIHEFDPHKNTWQKLHLAFTPDKGIKEILIPSSPPAGDWNLESLDSTQRVETHESYHSWIASWTPSLPTQTTLLTIDYGDTIDRLYHRQPRGTIRAYYRQQRLTGPEVYARFGKQDLTADVNFSTLIDQGDELGLKTHSLQNQHDFILTHLPNTAPDHRLINPEGPGSAFKILHQSFFPL
ncbi:MAG: SAM-dependent methyltransferase [Verrucomicrobiota bacterium]